MSRITIKDIARALRLNISTVSRALRNQGEVSEETRRMVQQTAAELGYQPNLQAIHFRKQRSGLIGLVIPHMNMFFLPSVIEAMEGFVREKGYNLVVFQSGDSLAKEIEIARMCQNFSVDGLLVSVSKETSDAAHFSELVAEGTPVVFFDRTIVGADLPHVVINDAHASEMAVAHLFERGYQRIGGLFDDAHLRITQERYRGYYAALEQAGRPLRAEDVFFTANMEEGRQSLQYLLQRSAPRPDALFVMSDELLAAAMQVTYELGIRIPQDLAIVSISDGKLPYFFAPKITHIAHSGYTVGWQSAQLLFDLLATKGHQGSGTVELETRLVILESA